MYLIDYHTHTRLSPDSEAPLAEMAQAAVRAGLSELCVTDHYDLLELDGTPAAAPCDWAPAVEQLREILRLAVHNGRSIEVNTYNGRTVDDWRPVLALYREVGGQLVTVGSDAHSPENVAKGVREAYELLADTGFRYVTVYEKRVPRPVKL